MLTARFRCRASLGPREAFTWHEVPAPRVAGPSGRTPPKNFAKTPPKTPAKSHVKPHTHLNLSESARSTWHKHPHPFSTIEIDGPKTTIRSHDPHRRRRNPLRLAAAKLYLAHCRYIPYPLCPLEFSHKKYPGEGPRHMHAVVCASQPYCSPPAAGTSPATDATGISTTPDRSVARSCTAVRR
jgi:hypothetical protein